MDSGLERLRALAADILKVIDRAGVEDIERYIEEREKIVEEMQQATLRPEEKTVLLPLLLELLEQERSVTDRMEQLKAEAEAEIGHHRKQSTTLKRYQTAYEGNPSDTAYFIDKRK